MASKKVAAARNRRIAAQNKAFDELSRADKRIALARDVIVQLAAGKLIADHVYAEGDFGSTLFKKGVRVPDQEVELKAAKCRVCGIGSLFVCGVKRADRLFGKDLGCSDEYSVERSDNVKYLKRFFTERQLDLIEEVYENSCHPGWESVEDDTERMTLIMQNIVANGGTFKPNKAPVATFTMPGYKD